MKEKLLKTIEEVVAMICITIIIISAQFHGYDSVFKLLGVAVISGLGGYSLRWLFERRRR